MAICEFTKNGKIVKSRIDIAMKLLKDEIIMLDLSYKQCLKAHNEMNDYCKRNLNIDNKDDMELYMIHTQLCANRREVNFIHSHNLYRFFYGIGSVEDNEEEDAEILFYYNYPINVEKFEKERIKHEIIESVLKKKNYIELNSYTQKNIKTFYNNLLI